MGLLELRSFFVFEFLTNLVPKSGMCCKWETWTSTSYDTSSSFHVSLKYKVLRSGVAEPQRVKENFEQAQGSGPLCMRRSVGGAHTNIYCIYCTNMYKLYRARGIHQHRANKHKYWYSTYS